MQEARLPGQQAGAPPQQAGDSSLFSWTAAADSGAPLPCVPPRGRPQAEAPGLERQERGRREPTCVPRNPVPGIRPIGAAVRDPGFSSIYGATPRIRGEASGVGGREPGAPQGPGLQAGAGARLRHRPPGPPPPARPNSTPREGGADKGLGAARSAPDLPRQRALFPDVGTLWTVETSDWPRPVSAGGIPADE